MIKGSAGCIPFFVLNTVKTFRLVWKYIIFDIYLCITNQS